MADKLTVESQKCDLLDSNTKTIKAENVDLNGGLKMALSQLDTAKASLNMMSVGSKKLDGIQRSEKEKTYKHGIGYTDSASTLTPKVKTIL